MRPCHELEPITSTNILEPGSALAVARAPAMSISVKFDDRKPHSASTAIRCLRPSNFLPAPKPFMRQESCQMPRQLLR